MARDFVSVSFFSANLRQHDLGSTGSRRTTEVANRGCAELLRLLRLRRNARGRYPLPRVGARRGGPYGRTLRGGECWDHGDDATAGQYLRGDA